MSKHLNNSSDDSDGNNTNLNRSREKEESYDELENNIKNYNNTSQLVQTKLSIEECIAKFDADNLKYIKDNKQEKIKNDVNRNAKKTPEKESDIYSNKIIALIQNMKKTTDAIELPCLTYGQQLTDEKFIKLLEECIKYANYNLETDEIEKIKSKLINSHLPALQNLFKRGQALKDVIENALLTILTTKEKTDQDDNFNLLDMQRTTATPILNMNFSKKEEYKLNAKEFIDIFSSPVYLKNFIKTLKNFTDKVPSKKEIKKIIENYFNNYYVYFCEFPQNIFALTIHTGNIYLSDKYLSEFYNEKNDEDQIIIREKIILNLGHELAHILLREISDMRDNFFIRSNYNNNKIKSQNIKFKDKFISKFHLLEKNESGNLMDYNFFNNYYFEELYQKEAELFFSIKSIKSIKEYKKRMDKIIKEEKNKNLSPNSVNKFKKLFKEPPRHCIWSRILGTNEVSEEEYNKKVSESDESESEGDENID